MFTGTADKTQVRFFLDGELIAEAENAATTDFSYYNNYIFIGAEAKTNTVTPYSAINGLFSDFRIYATALTPEQILELYHTSATIDNKGSTYGREIIENKNISITKKGQIITNNIVEQENTQTSIKKTTNNINSYNFYEY